MGNAFMFEDDPIKASDIEHKLIEHIWHDRFPVGQVSVLAGIEGKGKSMLAALIVAQVTQNGGAAIASLQEDGKHVSKARLEAAGADLDKVYIPPFGYNFPTDVEKFAQHVEDFGAKIAVFDAASQHLEPRLADDQGVRAALTPLAYVAEELGCALVFIAHTLRHLTKRVNPLHAVQAPGLVRAARNVALFGVVPEGGLNDRAVVWVKDNNRPHAPGMTLEIEAYDFSFDNPDGSVAQGTTGRLIVTSEDADLNPVEVMLGRTTDDASGPKADKREDCAEWLTIFLSTGKAPAKEVRDAAAKQGFSWSTLRRAAEDVGVEKYREGFGKGSKLWWSLPEDHPALVSEDADEDDDEDGTVLGSEDGENGENGENGEALSEDDLPESDDDFEAGLRGLFEHTDDDGDN